MKTISNVEAEMKKSIAWKKEHALVYGSKLPLFCKFNVLKKDIYAHQGTLQIFDFFNLIKSTYLLGSNIFQLVFDFIGCSIVT